MHFIGGSRELKKGRTARTSPVILEFSRAHIAKQRPQIPFSKKCQIWAVTVWNPNAETYFFRENAMLLYLNMPPYH